MHDVLDILGVSADATADAIRRARSRQLRRFHPDFDAAALLPDMTGGVPADAALDFIDVRPLVERMRDAFFASPVTPA